MCTIKETPNLTRIAGQVENAEVLKRKYGNQSTETEVRKWEEKPLISV